MMAAALVLPLMMLSNPIASATRRFRTPYTRRLGATTSLTRQVQSSWYTDGKYFPQGITGLDTVDMAERAHPGQTNLKSTARSCALVKPCRLIISLPTVITASPPTFCVAACTAANFNARPFAPWARPHRIRAHKAIGFTADRHFIRNCLVVSRCRGANARSSVVVSSAIRRPPNCGSTRDTASWVSEACEKIRRPRSTSMRLRVRGSSGRVGVRCSPAGRSRFTRRPGASRVRGTNQ